MADRRLQVFHAVAKRMSFTKAAEVLFMTQPAVTFQIKQLEEQYDTRLFARGHGRIELTPAGELVLQYADRILGLSAELEARLKEMTDGLSGPLLIGASMTIAEFMLPRVLGEFKARYPGVQARLIVANSETIENRVAEHLLDVGLIEAPSRLPGLMIEACCEDELQVIVSPRHPLARLKSVSPGRLVQHRFISREAGSGTREFADLYFRKAGIRPEDIKLDMELGSPEAIKSVVAAGLGFAIMSRVAVDKEKRLGELAALPLFPKLIRTLSLVYPKEKFRSRLVNTFIAFAKDRLASAHGTGTRKAG
ncbi:MAG: LysR family transcriptional regulator [Betaproteobacteria bacterium]|nr:LysR family transcriptional regulator [Betaproteobacteria bacterium]